MFYGSKTSNLISGHSRRQHTVVTIIVAFCPQFVMVTGAEYDIRGLLNEGFTLWFSNIAPAYETVTSQIELYAPKELK